MDTATACPLILVQMMCRSEKRSQATWKVHEVVYVLCRLQEGGLLARAPRRLKSPWADSHWLNVPTRRVGASPTLTPSLHCRRVRGFQTVMCPHTQIIPMCVAKMLESIKFGSMHH